MSEETQIQEDTNEATVTDDVTETPVETPVEHQPTDDKVKANIQKAYEERDQMAAKLKEYETKAREAELKALEEGGKLEEAMKLRMSDMQKELELAKAQNVALTRDAALKGLLAGLDFVTPKAAEIAYNDIVQNLVQDATGQWVSRIGQSMEDYLSFYQNDEGNKFLFKVKQSTGSKTMQDNASAAPVQQQKSIREMSAAELVEYYKDPKNATDDKNTWI